MGPRGMNVIDMTVKLHLSLSPPLFLVHFLIRKKEKERNPHRMTLPLYISLLKKLHSIVGYCFGEPYIYSEHAF